MEQTETKMQSQLLKNEPLARYTTLVLSEPVVISGVGSSCSAAWWSMAAPTAWSARGWCSPAALPAPLTFPGSLASPAGPPPGRRVLQRAHGHPGWGPDHPGPGHL